MLERGKMDRDLVEFVVIDQLVPKEHLLRKIDAAVDFTQLYEMVEPLYCEDNGRPSIDPVVLFKMVLIQHLYGLPSLRRTASNLRPSIKGKAPRLLARGSVCRKSPAGAGLFLIDMVEWARVMKRCWNAGKWIEIW